MFLSDPTYRPVLIFFTVLGLFALYRLVRARLFADPVVDFAPDDPTHKAAVAKAQASLQEFWSVLRGRPPETEFGLKVGLPAGGGTEHIWLMADERTEANLTGRLMSRPQHLKLREGDAVTFRPEQISDWMIRDATGTRGAYTIQAMLKTLPPAAARQMAEQQGVALQD